MHKIILRIENVKSLLHLSNTIWKPQNIKSLISVEWLMVDVSSLKLFSAYLLRAQSQFELDSEDVHLVSIEFKEKAEQRALLLHQTSLKT